MGSISVLCWIQFFLYWENINQLEWEAFTESLKSLTGVKKGLDTTEAFYKTQL